MNFTCICMTASVWSSVVFAWASNTKGYLHRVTTPSWPWGYRDANKRSCRHYMSKWSMSAVEVAAADSPTGTSASGSMWRSHFWCQSGRPARGYKTYRTEWCVLLSHSPAATGKWGLLHHSAEHGSWWLMSFFLFSPCAGSPGIAGTCSGNSWKFSAPLKEFPLCASAADTPPLLCTAQPAAGRLWAQM